MKANDKYMRLAIQEAKQAAEDGDFAIGAVIVCDDVVIAKSGNKAVIDNDQTAHAEMLALRKAFKKLKTRYLRNCVLYTTNEPCPMCATTCVWAELKEVVYGANMQDLKKHWHKKGEDEEQYKKVEISCEELFSKSVPQPKLVKDYMRQECLELFELY